MICLNFTPKKPIQVPGMNRENGQGSGDMLDLSWLFRDR